MISMARSTSAMDAGSSMKHWCFVKFAKHTIVLDVFQITQCTLESINVTDVESTLPV
jgi:hypothetical protein